MDYSDPYKHFPFINPGAPDARYLIVNDYYHDTMFPYSELKNTRQISVELRVANGLSKIYVSKAANVYNPGDLVLIYRRHTGEGTARYKSCVTSYGVVVDVMKAKSYSKPNYSFEDVLKFVGNKSVYSTEELRTMYDNDANMVIIDLLYCGYFGAGNNVNMDWLDNNGFWPHGYPTSRRLSLDEFKAILTEGGRDVSNVIID